MKTGDSKIMALCDREEEYAQMMTDFLKRHRNLPWELHTYTDAAELFRREEEGVEMLVTAESAYCSRMQELSAHKVVVLNESGIMKWEDVSYVDKYQEAEEVYKQLLGIYLESGEIHLPMLHTGCKTIFIGNYSPVRRCMQTSFALTMSLMLARDHPTLYLNFEHCAGLAELLPDMQTMDLADLLYFLHAEKDKFRLRLQAMLRHRGELAFVPPMKSGQNLLTVTREEWLGLLQRIEELGEYEYVVLDLSESIQGLYEILRLCRKVYTLTREDRIARSKLLQYEHVLSLYEYGDVLGKTEKLSLSHIQKLPEEPELLTKGELAELVESLLKKLKEEDSGDGKL